MPTGKRFRCSHCGARYETKSRSAICCAATKQELAVRREERRFLQDDHNQTNKDLAQKRLAIVEDGWEGPPNFESDAEPE